MKEISLEQLGALVSQRNSERRSKYNVDELIEHFMTFEKNGEITIRYFQLLPIEAGVVPEMGLEFAHIVSTKENLREDITRLLNDPTVSDFPTFRMAKQQQS
jgi:hypothetical protein